MKVRLSMLIKVFHLKLAEKFYFWTCEFNTKFLLSSSEIHLSPSTKTSSECDALSHTQMNTWWENRWSVGSWYIVPSSLQCPSSVSSIQGAIGLAFLDLCAGMYHSLNLGRNVAAMCSYFITIPQGSCLYASCPLFWNHCLSCCVHLELF